jgi:hypothetical protein
MSMLPPNTTAQALSNGQTNTAFQQQATREDTYGQIANNQSVAATNNLSIEARTGDSTAENLAAQALANHAHQIKENAGLTQGAQGMAELANRYARNGDDIATIANAIHKGLRL